MLCGDWKEECGSILVIKSFRYDIESGMPFEVVFVLRKMMEVCAFFFYKWSKLYSWDVTFVVESNHVDFFNFMKMTFRLSRINIL